MDRIIFSTAGQNSPVRMSYEGLFAESAFDTLELNIKKEVTIDTYLRAEEKSACMKKILLKG